jgi:nicotinamidase/pyrazinamidase
MSTLLNIIDPQNDFCHKNGSLYVPNADNDMLNLSEYIKNNIYSIDDIIVSLDDHHKMDISHALWWINNKGEHPKPFTEITFDDILNNKWNTTIDEHKLWSEFYVKTLKEQGNFPLFIWPYHCIIGTWGSNIFQPLDDALDLWEKSQYKSPTYIRKGQSQLTEHYSEIKAEVETIEDNTKPNNDLIASLDYYDNIIVAGEALSHCLANSVRDMIHFNINPKKITILSDCTSNVYGFDNAGDVFINEMKSIGVTFTFSK